MTTIVNGRLLGQGSNSIIMKGNAGFTFNGFNLNNGRNIRVTSCNSDDFGAIDFQTYNHSLQDGGGVLGRYFRTHTINVGLSLVERTHEDLLALMDEVKYQCSAIEAPLRIKSGELIRERTATCTDIKFSREYYNINWLGNVQIVFQAVNPHSHALLPLTLNVIGETGTYKTSLGYLGRATSFFTLNIAIETAGTSQVYYKLGGYTLSIASRNYNQGDIIKFDGPSKKVTINGNEVEYTGSFRPLEYGDNPLEVYYIGTFTATLSYYENFL